MGGGSADGKAVYCKCTENKPCLNHSLPSTEFGVFFEDGSVVMKYPGYGGRCSESICVGSTLSVAYDDSYEIIQWKSRFFGNNYFLNRESLMLKGTELPKRNGWKSRTYFKQCEVMTPNQATATLNTFIKNRLQMIRDSIDEQLRKNKI